MIYRIAYVFPTTGIIQGWAYAHPCFINADVCGEYIRFHADELWPSATVMPWTDPIVADDILF